MGGRLTGAVEHAGLMESSRAEAKKAEEHALQELKRRSGRDAFVQRARNSHHLLSTRAQPGVYRTPYQVASNSVPTVDGTSVEEHLRTLPSVQVCFLPICASLAPGILYSTSTLLCKFWGPLQYRLNKKIMIGVKAC